MVAIRAQFDGKRVVLPKRLPGLAPCGVILIFEDGQSNGSDRDAWTKAQEASFAKVWDNDEDAVYDSL